MYTTQEESEVRKSEEEENYRDQVPGGECTEKSGRKGNKSQGSHAKCVQCVVVLELDCVHELLLLLST